VSGETAATLTLQMKPPTAKPKVNVQGVNPATLKSALAGAIVAAQQAFNETREVNDRLKSSLRTNRVEIALKFTVKKQVQGGVDTAQLLPIGISAGGTYSRSEIQTITLVYGQ
jgi:NTP-dependent ternary system trypsin peptidase co-occuring protein